MLQKHEFAIYVRQNFVAHQLVCIADSQLVHRVTHVLRLKTDDQLIFFNEKTHSLVTIRAITRKTIEVFVEKIDTNEVCAPKLVMQLAVLRRDTLQEAVSSLTTLGVNEIELFTCEKMQRTWGGQEEYDRLYRCMIAAAEQSKCFALPKLHKPVELEQIFVEDGSEFYIMCDVHGCELIPAVLQAVQENKTIKILVGPEGDLTEPEKNIVVQHAYRKWRLTKTVLRSEQAAYLAAGVVRASI